MTASAAPLPAAFWKSLPTTTASPSTHTAQSLVAEGDPLCARFVIHGHHAGHVTLRFQHGRIAESWFNYDVAGALEQVGAPPATGP